MYEKYIVVFPIKREIGIRIDLQNGSVTVGGFSRDRTLIENLIIDYFTDSSIKFKFPQLNKIRYDFKLSVEKFTNAFKEMEENGIGFEQTNSLKKIFR